MVYTRSEQVADQNRPWPEPSHGAQERDAPATASLAEVLFYASAF